MNSCSSALFVRTPIASLARQMVGVGVLIASVGAAAQSSTAVTSTLQEVTVTGEAVGLKAPHAGGQVSRGGSLGLLGTGDVMDQPFSTVNYTAELLENQQARTLADVLINDASVRTTTAANGFDDTLTIRGFNVGAGDVGLNGLYGLAGARVTAQIAERVEVLKGPSALMNGIPPGGSIGGSVNVVTKRALEEPLTRLTTVYTGKQNLGLQLDLSRRFGQDKEWGIRFNGLVRDGETSIRDSNYKSGFGALGLDYRSARLRWSLDAISQHDDTDNFRPQISLAATLPSIPAPPDARANWFPGTTLVQKDNIVMSRVEFDLNDALTAYAAIGYRDGKNDQLFPVSGSVTNVAGNFTIRNSYYDSYSKTTTGEAGLRWRLNTGPVSHLVTFGVTGLDQEAGNAYIQSPAATVGNSNLYNPGPLPTITAARTAPVRATDTKLTSYAIADTMSFNQGRLLVTVGARDQTVEVSNASGAAGYKASAVTPLLGVVFKPLDNLSVYGNYTAGLTRGTIVGAGYDNTNAVLPPYKTKQYEAGVKMDLGRITTHAAVYQIERLSTVRTAPTGAPGSLGSLAYEGELRARGLELSAYGELQRGLRGMASINFADPKLTKTQGGVNQGNDAAGMPDRTANAGIDWDTPWLQGLSLNGRAIYTSGSYLQANNAVRFDDWTRVDIGARYRTVVSGKPLVLRANVENLFDKNYWLTTGTYVTVGAPRTLVLSASVDF